MIDCACPSALSAYSPHAIACLEARESGSPFFFPKKECGMNILPFCTCAHERGQILSHAHHSAFPLVHIRVGIFFPHTRIHTQVRISFHLYTMQKILRHTTKMYLMRILCWKVYLIHFIHASFGSLFPYTQACMCTLFSRTRSMIHTPDWHCFFMDTKHDSHTGTYTRM
jgi:hypothetical protein